MKEEKQQASAGKGRERGKGQEVEEGKTTSGLGLREKGGRRRDEQQHTDAKVAKNVWNNC